MLYNVYSKMGKHPRKENNMGSVGNTQNNSAATINSLLMGPESNYRQIVGNHIALTSANGTTIYINHNGGQLNEKTIRTRAFTERIHQNQVSIGDSAYRFSTGHAPRGKGTWYFFKNRSQDIDGDYIIANGSYADAKKKAIAVAANYGWKNLYVGT